MEPKNKYQVRKLQSERNLSLEGLQDFFKPPRLSKPEMHLLLKPFFLLDRHADRFKPIEYVYSSVENGKALTRGWWVEPHSKYGLPGPFDRDVTVIIYELVSENFFSKSLPVPEIMPIGTLRDFAERMGITVTGPNIAAIKESLRRLQHTLCTCEETFFDNTKKRFISLSFRLLKGVGFVGEEDSERRKHEQNFVVFDESVLRNLNSGYVMVVDVQRLCELKTNIAKQLYAHLGYRFYVAAQGAESCWPADYDWLTIHLGIKPQKELWRAKQQLEPAHEELLRLGYISECRWDGWRVLYRPGPAWQGEQLRRKSGSARRREAPLMKSPNTDGSTTQETEQRDPLMPALTAFASGLPLGAEKIRAIGLTIEQATDLCQEKNLALRND